MLNKWYEINERLKAHHVNHPDPSRYSLVILLSLEILDQVTIKPKAHKMSFHVRQEAQTEQLPKVKPVIIIWGKKYKPTNQKKRKKDERLLDAISDWYFQIYWKWLKYAISNLTKGSRSSYPEKFRTSRMKDEHHSKDKILTHLLNHHLHSLLDFWMLIVKKLPFQQPETF